MEKSKLRGVWRISALLFLSCFFALTSFAQQKTLSGTVIGEDGAPIPGVTIVVQGTGVGTVTGIDGKFSFKAPANAKTLEVAYVAMKTQELAIGTQTTFSITLHSDITGVDEVIVVGYGTARKSDISGSVVSVNTDEMMKKAPENILQAIKGQAAGVMVTGQDGAPDANAAIRAAGLRGPLPTLGHAFANRDRT